MDIPKNCAECPNTHICAAPYYGGSKCQYEKEINEKTLGSFLIGNNHRGNTD